MDQLIAILAANLSNSSIFNNQNHH